MICNGGLSKYKYLSPYWLNKGNPVDRLGHRAYPNQFVQKGKGIVRGTQQIKLKMELIKVVILHFTELGGWRLNHKIGLMQCAFEDNVAKM